MRIMVVEDEAAIANDISEALTPLGYVVDIATDGEDAWFRGSTEDYDAIILDLSLPKLDGLSVLQRLRSEGISAPILVLTARSAWLQRVEGIDAGADDYLTKPFHMEELVARVGALLRRVGGHTTPILEVGDLRIDTRRLRALLKGRQIDLTPLEFRLLRYLAHNKGRVVSQFEISEHVYEGDREPDSNAIEALVARLRRKVGSEVIATRRGHGWRPDMPRRSPSIRVRLLAAAVVSILATLVVAGISLVSVFERQILKRVEQELGDRWTELAGDFEVGANGNPDLIRELTDPRYHQPYSGAYWQVTENGAVVMASRSLWDESLDTHGRAEPNLDSAAFEATGPSASTLYAISRQVSAGEGRTFDLTVALDHEEVETLRHAFERDVIRILGPIALVLVFAAWFQLRQSLNPLRDLDRQLKAVHDGAQPRLGTGFPREVEPVVADLNRLLDRQDELVRKARDRAGALAHGLKTPLTILGAEVRRLERRGDADVASRITGQLDLIRRHVDRELARARTAGASAAGGALTSAAETVDRLIRLMRHMPRGDGLEWQNEIPATLMLRIDPDDFGEVLGNLLDNARKWARSAVVVRGEVNGGNAIVSVSDDGPGFISATLDRAADRGLSGDLDEASTGLGLGIVHDILSEYGLEANVGEVDGWCRVSFAVPAAGDAAAQPAATDDRAEEVRISTDIREVA